MEIVIRTARLYVRPFCKEDESALASLLADGEVMRFLEPPYSRQRAAKFLEQAGLCRPPKILAVDTLGGTFAGYVIYHPCGEKRYELGWVLGREHWNKGYAGELTQALIADARHRTSGLMIECVPAQQATKHIALQYHFVHAGRQDGCDVYTLDFEAKEYPGPEGKNG